MRTSYKAIIYVIVFFILGVQSALALNSITIQNPLSNTNISGTISLSATTDLTAENVTFEFIDSGDSIVNTTVNATPGTLFNITFDTTVLADGAYTLNATAINSTGSSVVNQSINISVDTTNPNVTNVAVNDSIVTSSASIWLNATIIDATTHLVHVNASNSSTVVMSSQGSNVWAVTTTPSDLGCSSDGACFVRIRARDSLGNVNDTGNVSFTIDNTNPSVTGLIVNDTILNSSVGIRVNATVADANILTVTVGESSQVAMTNMGGNDYHVNSTPEAMGCTTDGTCVLTVIATDEAGNVNSTATISITVDNTAPSVTLNEPVNAANTSSTSINFNWTAIDAADASLSCDLTIDAVVNQSGVVSANNTATNHSVSGFSDGSHAWNITCVDDESNSATSSTYTFTVDTVVPSVTSPAVNDSVVQNSGSVNVSVTVTDATSGLVQVNVSGDGGTTMVAMAAPGGAYFVVTTGSSLGCSSNAVCTLTFYASDVVGLLNNSVTTQFTIDDVAPGVTLNGPVNAANTSSSTVNFNWTAVDAFDTSLSCDLTIDAVVNQSGVVSANNTATNHSVSGFSDGSHAWNITCVDDASNSDTSSTYTFTVDTVVPSVTSVAVNDSIVSSSASILLNLTVVDATTSIVHVNASNSSTVAMSDQGGNVWAVTTTPDALGCSSDGACFVGIRARDLVGNVNDTGGVSFTVDNTNPGVAGLIVNDTVLNSSSGIRVNVTAVDANILAVTVGNSSQVAMTNMGGNDYHVNSTPEAMGCTTDGTCVLTVIATDEAGNVNSTATISITVDNAEPTVLSLSSNDTIVQSDAFINVSVSVTDATSVSTVTVGNSSQLPMFSVVGSIYSLITNATALGCAGSGACSLTVVATDVVGNVNSTETTSITVDNVPPQMNSTGSTDVDIFYSASPGNNIINVRSNVTDTVGIENVTANFSQVGGGVQAMVFNSSTGFYEAQYTMTSSNFLFNSFNITLSAVDNASNVVPVSPAIPVVLYNMSVPAHGNACFRFGEGSTNFSQITNFADINMVMHMEVNGSSFCNLGEELPWGSIFQRVLTVNFSSINLSTEQSAQKLQQLGNAIVMEIVPPNQFGDSRIFVNDTIFAEISVQTVITMYNLPFASQPAVLGDNSSNLNSTSITWNQGGFNSVMGFITGNLTFEVLGFSGYNATDNSTPTMAFNSPGNDSFVAQANTQLNFTFNGTSTGISAANATLNNNQTYNLTNMTCVNSTPGSDTQTCVFNVTAIDGANTLNVTIYDYGGVAPGNSQNEIFTFTLDTVKPIVVNFTSNVTTLLTNQTNNNINISAVATDSNTSVTSVNVSGGSIVPMSNPAGNIWYAITNATALGCAPSGVCTLTLTASDAAGNINDSEALNLTIVGGTEGNASNILGNANITNITIGGSTNLSQVFTGNQSVNFTSNGTKVLDFAFNFDLGSLNFSNINITETPISGKNSIRILGLDLGGNTKAAYMEQTDTGINGVCILDQTNADPNNITSDCSGTDETLLQCTSGGTTSGQYTCTDLGLRLRIEGLNNSAVVQSQVTVSTPAASSGSGGGGGGGGASGGGLFVTGKIRFASLPANVEKKIAINAKGVYLNQIVFKPTERLTNINFDVVKAEKHPDFGGELFNVFQIDTGLEVSKTDGVLLKAEMTESMLGKTDPDEVRIYRYNEDEEEWQELDTVHYKVLKHVFTAETPGFSFFALGIQKKGAPPAKAKSLEAEEQAVENTRGGTSDGEQRDPFADALEEQTAITGRVVQEGSSRAPYVYYIVVAVLAMIVLGFIYRMKNRQTY